MGTNRGIKSSPRISHRTLRNGEGFTLLELLIVLFLAVLMIMLSAALFANTLSSSRLNATARDLSATIRHARSLAQIHGERQTVTINLDARQYGIEGRVSKNIPPDVGIKVTDPFSGDVFTGQYHITANPAGAVNGGAIVLWNKKKALTIQPDPVVGAVVIK
jgi:type II secretory pathway pseudopilin PulG